MNHRLSISQRLNDLPDSAWAYRVGLGTVSAPVIILLMGSFSVSGKLNELGWIVVVCGTLGMTFGGVATYAVQRPRRPIERALLLTMTTPFVALVIASMPFAAFAGLGFLFAMVLELTLMPQAIIVTACWSALYFSVPSPHRTSISALGPGTGGRSRGTMIAGSFVLLVALAIVF